MKPQVSTPLFRVENPSLPFNRTEGPYFAEALAGQWFDPTLDGALANIMGVMSDSRHYNTPAQLAIAVVTSVELEGYLASNHPIASAMYHFRDDYIIPRDGSVPIFESVIDSPDRTRIRKMAAGIVRREIGRGPITRLGRVIL